MTNLRLGMEAYERVSAAEPEIKLINRFAESNPTNLVEKVALLARAATKPLVYFSGATSTDAPRGLFSMAGLFKNDLFGVTGQNLYRYRLDTNDVIQITGVLQGTGEPYVTWDKGIGYERMFFSDGTLLQFYDGGTHASGILTSTVTPAAQVIEIGGAYYSWNTDVDFVDVNGQGPNGSSSNPWLANPGTDPLLALNLLLAFAGVSGTDFSTALSGPALLVTSTATGGPPATKLNVAAVSDRTIGNGITTSIFSGTGLSWGATTLLGGGIDALQQVVIPTGEGIGSLASLYHFTLCAVSGSQKVFYLRPGSTTMDALDFLEKESNPDPVVNMVTVGDVVTVMGEGSMEFWYATGDNNNPIAPISGRGMARGVVPGTAVNVKEDVLLVGNDRVVYSVIGGLKRVSTHGIEERIRTQLRREGGIT